MKDCHSNYVLDKTFFFFFKPYFQQVGRTNFLGDENSPFLLKQIPNNMMAKETFWKISQKITTF